jgi:hypothetical protein
MVVLFNSNPVRVWKKGEPQMETRSMIDLSMFLKHFSFVLPPPLADANYSSYTSKYVVF